MAGTETPAPSDSRPAELSEPSTLSSDLPGTSLSFTTSSLTTESTDSDDTIRPVEAITMTTLHSMLARVLERTTALWQAQVSTNHILDELRQSIPAPQENAEMHERLRRVEALAETLAHSQRVDPHPPAQPGQGTGTTSSAYQGRLIPQSVPQPSPVQDVGETPSCDAPVNPRSPQGQIVSTQETTYHTDPILHASGEQHPTSGPSVHIHDDEEVRLSTLLSSNESYSRGSTRRTLTPQHTIDNVDSQALAIIPPLGHVGQSTAGPVISPGQIGLPEPQHGSVLTAMPLPSAIAEDQPLGVLDHHVSSTSHAYVPSGPAHTGSEDTVHARQEQLEEAEREPSIPPPPDFDEAPTVEPIQSTTQDPTSEHAFYPPEFIQWEREQMALEQESSATTRGHEGAHKVCETRIASLEEGLARIRFQLENKQQLSLAADNMPWVAVAERDEALRPRLVDLTKLIRQMLALCGEKGVLMEQQWSERLRWKEESSQQMQGLMYMTSLLVDEQKAARQREEEQRLADEGSPGIEQVLEEIQRMSVEHRGLLDALSEAWRADSNRQHEDTISAVRATANEQVPYNVQGYLDEFSKALGTEVRMLLGEVGKLREERRLIQHELGYLMMMQSALAPGGAFGTDWPPEYSSPHAWPSPAGIPLPESPQPRPGWHVVSLRGSRRAPKPEPPPAPERRVRSWATWQPNPALAPTPPSIEPTLLVPERGSPGLFGPRSPRDSYRVLPREIEEPELPNPNPNPTARTDAWTSWTTRPDPWLTPPTPPFVESTREDRSSDWGGW